jgi:hypothetical protein
MLERMKRMGGRAMLPDQNQTSAFAAPPPPHLSTLSDDDSINNEYVQHTVPTRSVRYSKRMIFYLYFL